MKLSERDLEDRVRRTLAAVADTPLDEPVPAAPARGRGPLLAVAVAAAVVAVVAAVAFLDRDEQVRTVADAPSLAEHWLVHDEDVRLFRAEQRLVRECMEAAGQPYVEADPEVGGLDEGWSRLGRTDAQFADRVGYVVKGGSGRNPAVDELRTAAQRDAWSLALTGEPWSPPGGLSGPSVPLVHPVTGEEVGGQGTGGCFGQANVELYGDISRHASLRMWVSEMRGTVETQAVEDPRFSEAVRRWSSCMKERGYDYAGPLAPVQAFGEAEGTRPTAAELATARADVECKEATGLVRTFDELRAEHGRVVVERHGALLAEYRSIVDRALAKAEAMLAAPGSTTTTCCDGR